MERTYPPKVKIMLDAVRKSSRKLVRDFGEIENLQVSKKGPKDFVTSADIRTEKILIEELRESFPEYGFLTEESGVIKGDPDCPYRWIVDPIDGTTNFIHGVPFFCTTVALEVKNPDGSREILAAVTDAPILKELFWAEKGAGAWFEQVDLGSAVKMQVSSRNNFSESLLACGRVGDTKSISEYFSATRVSGSTALGLAYLAAGRYDCFIHDGAKPWDIAAGVLFINEAKGICSDINGKNEMFKNKSIIAANSDLHPLVLKKMFK